MVRKITTTAGGWSKRTGLHNQLLSDETAVRALAAAPCSTDAWSQSAARHLSDQLLAARTLDPIFARAVRDTVTAIVQLETRALQLPTTPPVSIIEQVVRRRRQQALLAFNDRADQLLRQWLDALRHIIRRIVDAAPANTPHTNSAGGLTAPLIELVPAPAELVASIVADIMRFATDEPTTVRPGAALAHRCKDALLNVSQINEETARKSPHRLTSPKQSGLAGEALVAAYLAGTPLQRLLTTPVGITVPRRAYQMHAAIFAPTGHGKTQTLQHIIVSFLNEPDPPAMFIMDSMGSMLKKIERLAVFDNALKDRLVVLDPHDAPAFNFFKLEAGSYAQQMELFFYLFKALDQSLTPRQATTVAFLVQLMQKIGGTLETFRQVCEDRHPRYTHAIDTLYPIARDFFNNQFYGRDKHINETKAQIAARLYTLARNPAFNRMFAAAENKFNAYDCIQQKKIVLVSTDRLFLGDDGSAIFGRYILAQCLAAALARAPLPEHQRHLALFIVDEAKAYFDEQTEKFLSDARQFGLGMFFATQYVSQLPEGVRRAMYGNTAIKYVGPVEYGDRLSLAREMNTTPEMIAGMRSFDRSHTEFALHVRADNLTPHAIKISVPMGTLERQPTMSDAAYRAMRARNRQRIAADDNVPTPTTPPPAIPPAVLPAQPPPRQPRDFGKHETVTLLGTTYPALLDTGAQVSAIIATHCDRIRRAFCTRLRFTITTPNGASSFERPIVGTQLLHGMHAANAQCPVVEIEITLDGYTALERFAVTIDPAPQLRPIILGETFFARAPFAARINPTGTMLAERRHGQLPTRTQWDSDHGEPDAV